MCDGELGLLMRSGKIFNLEQIVINTVGLDRFELAQRLIGLFDNGGETVIKSMELGFTLNQSGERKNIYRYPDLDERHCEFCKATLGMRLVTEAIKITKPGLRVDGIVLVDYDGMILKRISYGTTDDWKIGQIVRGEMMEFLTI